MGGAEGREESTREMGNMYGYSCRVHSMMHHHRLDGHEFEPAPGVGDGQGGLACCGPWGRKESDTTERLN